MLDVTISEQQHIIGHAGYEGCATQADAGSTPKTRKLSYHCATRICILCTSLRRESSAPAAALGNTHIVGAAPLLENQLPQLAPREARGRHHPVPPARSEASGSCRARGTGLASAAHSSSEKESHGSLHVALAGKREADRESPAELLPSPSDVGVRGSTLVFIFCIARCVDRYRTTMAPQTKRQSMLLGERKPRISSPHLRN